MDHWVPHTVEHQTTVGLEDHLLPKVEVQDQAEVQDPVGHPTTFIQINLMVLGEALPVDLVCQTHPQIVDLQTLVN